MSLRLVAAHVASRAHLEKGDVALFCPDWTVERFSPDTSTGGTDGVGRGMRYHEWVPPTIHGTTYESNLVYVLREADGRWRVVQYKMVLGIFPRQTWTRLLAETGFARILIVEHSGRDVFRALAA